MSEELDNTSIFTKLDEADDYELQQAAEAVVDAAICRHALRGFETVPIAVRSLLIKAVKDDPSVVEELFRDGGCTIH